RADSRGFWWGADTQAYYYDLETDQGLPLSEAPGAFDLAHGRLLLNRLLVPPDAMIHSRLLLADPLGRQRLPLSDEPGEVLNASFSDDGNYLVYTHISLPGLDPMGHRVVTTTLVLTDLDTPDGPQYTTLYTQPSAAGDASVSVRGAFVPGTRT